jgi:ribosomal protein S18 acetylase RimI-like enzyme
LPLAFPSSAAYLWNLYVLPSERSSGIGSALASARLQLTRESGFREGWRMVAPTNAPSLRTVQKTAAATRVVGEIRFLQLLGHTYARFTPSGR